ncbi:MAG: taurine ABC transporter permease, partial [Burkholderiaceae bacterium]
MTKPNPPEISAEQTTKTSRFRELGEGSSLSISVITIAVLLLVWYGVTRLGWIKPLFLPPPQAVIQQFWEYATGVANDKP